MAGFVDYLRMAMGWWSGGESSAEPVNYTVQAAHFYTAGSVMGMAIPNAVTSQEFTAGALDGDVK